MAKTHLQCRECKKEYEPTFKYVCDECFGPLDVKYNFPSISGTTLSVIATNIFAFTNGDVVNLSEDVVFNAAIGGPTFTLSSSVFKNCGIICGSCERSASIVINFS